MLAAAHGLCGQKAGIACILGTGSNSCFYNGKEIVSNISPLGFILGDEGSGAVLGKLLVGDILKNQLPATGFIASPFPIVFWPVSLLLSHSIWKNRLSAN